MRVTPRVAILSNVFLPAVDGVITRLMRKDATDALRGFYRQARDMHSAPPRRIAA